MIEFTAKLNEAIESFGEAVLVTLVKHRGSIPQVEGAKAIITSSGLFWGTVGGGKVEQAVINEALQVLGSSNKSHHLNWNLQKDIGMTCGGEVSFYFEKYGEPRLKVAVFGAGHVAQALIPLLCTLDATVTCIDSRTDWIEKIPSHSKLKKILSVDPSSEVKNLTAGTFVLSMTQGHGFDVPILAEVFKKSEYFPYIGVIGSDQKAQVIKSDLMEKGISTSELERLFCPLGLPFGSNTPVEISFSIIAQLLTERDQLS